MTTRSWLASARAIAAATFSSGDYRRQNSAKNQSAVSGTSCTVANVCALTICSGPTSLPALEIATLRGSLAKQATRERSRKHVTQEAHKSLAHLSIVC
ncbi:hypothetical protein [Mycobacterium sp. AZCC_0083]|uniref:hypothetical protein n=1 Tax=Mycobacterium sp. AZCC_0083 TaxID=2735882 RepID=UPI00162218D9|nr:hypothetical protein [Mycobacterium sp. AZCC_0083]MBB5160536.1 hypothetical protein [Mycobacterium sp. AZCC_0083]